MLFVLTAPKAATICGRQELRSGVYQLWCTNRSKRCADHVFFNSNLLFCTCHVFWQFCVFTSFFVLYRVRVCALRCVYAQYFLWICSLWFHREPLIKISFLMPMRGVYEAILNHDLRQLGTDSTNTKVLVITRKHFTLKAEKEVWKIFMKLAVQATQMKSWRVIQNFRDSRLNNPLKFSLWSQSECTTHKNSVESSEHAISGISPLAPFQLQRREKRARFETVQVCVSYRSQYRGISY